MKICILYIHGRGGSAEEAEHYKALFPDCDVIGLDYKTDAPWETGPEIGEAIRKLRAGYENIVLIAVSIGAYYATWAENSQADRAYFVSPVTDMERLIADMMAEAGVSEQDLRERGRISTSSGNCFDWEYLCRVREHSVPWNTPTEILYGGKDCLVARESVESWAVKHGAGLTVMESGEHWFHTEEQMAFLDNWLRTH